MRPTILILLLILCGCRSAGMGGSQCATEDCQTTTPAPWYSVKGKAGHGCGVWCGHCGRCYSSLYNRHFDSKHATHRALKMAQADLHQMHPSCKSCHFRRGYEQAYIDVALGGSGAVPALPPPSYWKTSARSPDGHQQAQEWFAGYAAGAGSAVARFGGYNRVASSGVPGYEQIMYSPGTTGGMPQTHAMPYYGPASGYSY